MKKIIIIVLNIFLTVASANGAWQGPNVVLEADWGSAAGQFGMDSEDMGDKFPNMLAVSSSGKILIGDSLNKRIQVFSASGALSSIVTPQGFPVTYRPVTYWPLSLFVCGDQNIYTERNEYVQIYDFNGSLIKNVTNLDGGVDRIDQQCNFSTYNPSAKRYGLYSPAGQFIKYSMTRPLELGLLESKSGKSGSYLHSIKYLDKTFSFLLAWASLNSFRQDATGNIIVAAQTDGKEMVYKISPCGKIMGQMQIPEDQGHIVDQVGPEQIGAIDYEYGAPVIAPNGDVYTWKRTPDKYSIIKWTWVDDPNVPTGPDAPTGLTLMPSISGVYLTWTASPSDPGCVTGYEVARATSAGGVFSNVGTVNAGMFKYNDTTASTGTTYYYKIRAVAGSEFSPYTSEVSGKR